MITLILCTGAALAGEEPRPIDLEHARTLPLPTQHRAFQDCNCVGMAWYDPEPLMLDVPADDIVAFHHVVTGAVDRLEMHTTDGASLLLEQAPCAFVAAQADAYARALARPVQRVDAAGAQTAASCADPLQQALDWSAEREATTTYEIVGRDDGPMALADLVVVARGPHAGLVEGQSRREWAGLRPRIGHCWAREAEPPPRSSVRMRLVAASDGTVGDVRVVGRGSGSERVDSCLSEVVATAALPSPPSRDTKVSLELAYAE